MLNGEPPFTFNIIANGNWNCVIDELKTTTDTSFSGKGDSVTPIFSGTTGAYTFTHDGDSNFAVWVYTTDGRDLLINEIGEYSGTQIVEIPSGSNAFFEITANGSWSITPN